MEEQATMQPEETRRPEEAPAPAEPAAPPTAEQEAPPPAPCPAPTKKKSGNTTMIAIVAGVLIVGVLIAIIMWVKSRDGHVRQLVLEELEKDA